MPDVWKILKDSSSFDFLTSNSDLIQFDIPLKKEVKHNEDFYAVNWVKYLSKSPQKIQDFLKPEREKLINKDFCISGVRASSAIKIDNTLTFLKKLQNQNIET